VTRPLVIDADGHVEEDLHWIVDRLPDSVKPLAPTFRREDDGAITNLIEGRPWSPDFPFPRGKETHRSAGGVRRIGGRDPRERLAVLDAEGIDAAVLFPSLALMWGLYQDGPTAAALCAAGNDWTADYCRADPQRLIGVAVLPQQDPALAVRELERCVAEHGFVAGMIRPNKIAGRTVDDPAFDVLWEAACALDVPIACHEAYLGSQIDTVGHDRVKTYAAAHVISHPLEMMMGMLGVALAGVLQRFPTLRLGFLEAGCSWAPYWVERIEEHFELAPDDYQGGDPHGVLNTRTWLTFEVEEQGMPFAAELGWADNICFASDYPHFDAVYPGAVKAVRERGLDPALERKVLGDNALAFYGDRLRRIVEPLAKEE
jgi:predicted TIM-barrel fold metal-dependent hydrolase